MTADTPAKVFTTPKLTGAARNQALDDWVQRFPKRLLDREVAQQWLRTLMTPQSRRWIFLSNSKAGTSSTKRFLFELEFGVPLTVRLEVPVDINAEVAVQRLCEADVFRRLSDMDGGPSLLDNSLRLTTVRNPYARAVSGFLYICKSNDMARLMFAWDRIRMTAMTGFDWATDARTEKGFGKFLDYLDSEIASRGPNEVDQHWRPQTANIRPAIYRPQIVGKTENLGEFYRQVAEHLGTPLPAKAAPTTNRNTDPTDRNDLLTPATRKQIATIFASDFEAFKYDPDAPETSA